MLRAKRGALARPGSAWGCLRRVGDELGAGPEALRGRDPAGGLGRSPGTGPAPPPRGPGAPGSRRWRSAGRGRGGAIGRSASACPWRRSVSARRADPPSASTSAREGLRGLCRVCAVLTESGCRTGSVHLTCAARSRPLSKRSISDAAPGSGGGSRPEGAEPLRRGRRGLPGRPGGCRAPGRRALGWPACAAGAAHAGAESDRRRGGQDGAHHRIAPAGNRVPARPARAATPAAARCGSALGGRLHPRADPVGVLLHRLRHGACTRQPHRRPGPPAAARGTDNAASAPGQALRARKDREGGDPRGPGTTTVASACPSPAPDDSSARAPVASAGAVGSSYAGAAARALGKSLQARGPFWRDDTRGRHRPMGELVQPHPTPPEQRRRPLARRRTPLPSHTAPPPPRHPPRHNHPPQNPGRSTLTPPPATQTMKSLG